MVQAKQNSTVGDVLLAGKAAVDLAQTVTDATASGRYYLSAQTAGQMAKQRPAMGQPVLFNYGDGSVFVQASLHDFIEDHVHFQFTLTCLPAGETTPPEDAGDHVVTAADDALPGWLPADDAVFAGLAPAGAVWGYNLSQHAALRAVWPPQPMTAATLIWDTGSGGTVVPATLAVCNRDGIWWLSDCFGEVPWPVDLNTVTSSSLSDSSSSGEGPPCGFPSPMQLTLWFTQMLFGTDQTSVTSLTSANTDRLAFRNCLGDPATTGDLIAEVLTDLVVDADPEESSLVLSSLDDTTLHVSRITEGLLAGAGVSLSSTHPLPTDDGVLQRGRITRGGAAAVRADVTSTMRGRLLDLGTLVRACHKMDTSLLSVDFEPTHGGVDMIEGIG